MGRGGVGGVGRGGVGGVGRVEEGRGGEGGWVGRGLAGVFIKMYG